MTRRHRSFWVPGTRDNMNWITSWPYTVGILAWWPHRNWISGWPCWGGLAENVSQTAVATNWMLPLSALTAGGCCLLKCNTGIGVFVNRALQHGWKNPVGSHLNNFWFSGTLHFLMISGVKLAFIFREVKYKEDMPRGMGEDWELHGTGGIHWWIAVLRPSNL